MRFTVFKNSVVTLLCLIILLLFLVFPEKISAGIIKGLLTCSNILIPSLFPFSVAAVFSAKSGALSFASKGKFTYYFSVFLMSAIGGYPIGAKMLSEEFESGKITRKDAEKALNFCINAGPSFVISFVGFSIFSSRKIGVLLLISHILASLTVFFVTLPTLCAPSHSICKKNKTSIADCFVNSVSDACSSIIIICGYAIFFAGITALFNSEFLPVKILNLSFEVTNSLMMIKNVYLASFLLGFSGISIICQVLTLSKSFLKRKIGLLVGRIAHGLISVLYLFVLLKIFKPDISVFGTMKNFSLSFSFYGTVVSVLIILCGICLISSIQTKTYEGKFIKDII